MTDDPHLPPEIDRATITTMQAMVRGAVNERHATVGEAAELARGYCYARHPALPATTLSAAVDYVLMSLQLLRPGPSRSKGTGASIKKSRRTNSPSTWATCSASMSAGSPMARLL
jgi:hypothetical protein